MKFVPLTGLLLALTILPVLAQAPQKPPRNIVIFVADGLRYGSVEPGNMPNMHRLKTEGVDFTNSHSLFPTITMVNASAITTGHYIGDTGNFGNTLYTGIPMDTGKGSPMAALENDAVLAEMNEKFGGNYLNEETLIARARAQGFSTAIIGKLGPTRLQDSTAAADGSETLIIDDNTGKKEGFALPTWFRDGMKAAFLADEVPGTQVPNIPQEVWQMKATTRIVLPHFKQAGKPFALLFWSRDPDMSQHNTKDSVGEVAPGINGPSGLAGTRNADSMFGELLAALKQQGLDQTTDIFVTADHGFVTISRESRTSPSAKNGQLAQGFLAADLAQALNLPKINNNFLGPDAQKPEVVVAGNGGADLIYLPQKNARKLARSIVEFLSAQDYVSAVFVNDKLGKIPGALAMSDVGFMGSAKTPVPSIYVSFSTFFGTDDACRNILQCSVGVHDTVLAAGQGSHGSLSRPETRNFMAAIGPDFKYGYADPTPVSNADIAPTLAHIAGIKLPSKGKLKGRVITEALSGGNEVSGGDVSVGSVERTLRSEPAANGARTNLRLHEVGEYRYFDFAGRCWPNGRSPFTLPGSVMTPCRLEPRGPTPR
jgi:predicted AlkP superfamily pyrophosphatase or phosphodiesterase